MVDVDLIAAAKAVARTNVLSAVATSGEVGCALLSGLDKVYTGICIDCACGIGACAEYAAIAEMLKSGESVVARIVAVGTDGTVLPPCGRCRELLVQVNPSNLETQVLLPNGVVKSVRELLPDPWQQ